MTIWYMHNPAPVPENNTYKLLWDFGMHTDHLISTRRPFLIIIHKKRELAKLSTDVKNSKGVNNNNNNYKLFFFTFSLAGGLSLESEWQQGKQPLSNLSGTVPSAPITVGIPVNLMFHNFLSSLTRFKYLSLFSLSSIFTQ